MVRSAPKRGPRRLSPMAFAEALPTSQVNVTHMLLMQSKPKWVGNTTTLDAHLFVIVERGSLVMNIDGRDVPLPPGSACWMPPGVTRQLRVRSGVPCQNWRVRIEVQNQGRDLELDCETMVRDDSGALSQHLQLLNDVRNKPHLQKEVGPLVSAFVYRFLSLPEWSEQPARQLRGIQRRRVERLVKRGLLLGITPREMAEEAGLSPDYFSRLFKATYNVSPRRYLLERRMELAGELLLDTTLRIKEVCAELGEPDVATFCKLFKRVTGKTPTQFRLSQTNT